MNALLRQALAFVGGALAARVACEWLVARDQRAHAYRPPPRVHRDHPVHWSFSTPPGSMEDPVAFIRRLHGLS